MHQFCWGLSALMTLVGTMYGAVSILLWAESAPQQAAAAGITLCLVVLPYLFARSVDELTRKD